MIGPCRRRWQSSKKDISSWKRESTDRSLRGHLHVTAIIAKITPGKESVVREYRKTLEKTLETGPYVLAPLKLHYLR
jgi:hypothetical protein